MWKRLRIFFIDTKWFWVVGLAFLVTVLWTYYSLEGLVPKARSYLTTLLPFQLVSGAVNAVVFVLLYWTILHGGFSRLSRKRISVKAAETNVRFEDVIGLETAKQEAKEIVELIKDRTRVKKIGGSIIRGLLMVGPPGCGKTLLAKAIATECDVPFLAISGSEFVEVFVGVGASRVRNLFKRARSLAKVFGSCIVFIDELDVIGRGRVFAAGGGGEETNSTQNQLLVEMDGLKSRGANVLVIGATNAMEQILDKALLRPGRFDRHLYVHLPHVDERKDLFRYYLKQVEHDAGVNVDVLAKRTIDKSGADIENIVRESALIAARNQRDKVSYADLAEAMDRIELGSRTGLRLVDKERRDTAFHEAGHLVVNFLLHPTHGVFKASIIPRKDTLGLVQWKPEEELHTRSRESLIGDIQGYLAGYVAEKIFTNGTTNGVASDFRHATRTAHYMVWNLGMGASSLVGDYTVIPEGQLSDEIRLKLNEDMERILKDCMKKAEECLTKHRHIVERFAEELVRKDELQYDEIERIFEHYKVKPVLRDRYPHLVESQEQEKDRT